VAAGWHPFGAAVRAVYQVDFVARDPAGDWRVLVDAETGTALFRVNLRNFAAMPGSVFEVSPVETVAALCPVSGGTRTFCAAVANVTFPNLATGADLLGSQRKGPDVDPAGRRAVAEDVPHRQHETDLERTHGTSAVRRSERRRPC